MAIKNIEIGVHKALKAYKMDKGMKAADADKWASSNLSEAVKRVNAAMDNATIMNDEIVLRQAFNDLKAWAQGTPLKAKKAQARSAVSYRAPGR